jgi:hypothetical protein
VRAVALVWAAATVDVLDHDDASVPPERHGQRRREVVSGRRFGMGLLAALGFVALILTAIVLYGVMARCQRPDA